MFNSRCHTSKSVHIYTDRFIIVISVKEEYDPKQTEQVKTELTNKIAGNVKRELN